MSTRIKLSILWIIGFLLAAILPPVILSAISIPIGVVGVVICFAVGGILGLTLSIACTLISIKITEDN